MKYLLSIARILSGSLLGNGLAFALTIYMARLYAPDDFAIYTIFSGSVAIGSVIVSGTSELLILNAQGQRGAMRLAIVIAQLGTVICLGYSILSAPVFFALGLNFRMVLACGAACLLAAYCSIGAVYLVAVRREQRTGMIYFTNTAGRATVQCLAGGLFQPSPASLVAGELISRIAQLLIYPLGAKVLFRSLRGRMKGQRIWTARHGLVGRFYLFNMPAAFADTASIWLPPIIFASLYGAAEGGYFSLIHRVSYMLCSIINNSAGNIFHRYVSSLRIDKRSLHVRTILLSGLLLILISYCLSLTLIALAGPALIVKGLGTSWAPMIPYAGIWCAAFFAQIVTIMVNRVALAMGWNGGKLLISLMNLTVIATSLLISYCYDSGPLTAFVSLTVSLCIAPGMFFVFVFQRLTQTRDAQEG